jgi:hypothetical protein
VFTLVVSYKKVYKNSRYNFSKNCKGQLKIQQMAFMLIGVTILFALVGIFFLAINLYDIQKTATSLEEDNALLLVSKLANSPEFSCGNSFGSSRSNCIDFDKLIILQGMSSKYQNFWGITKIQIRKIYPEDETICTEENYPDCGIINLLDKKVNSTAFTSNFVSLCRKDLSEGAIYNKCELALLMVASEDNG